MYRLYQISVLLAALTSVRAAIPAAGTTVQVQPTFRGSFPRTPCLSATTITNGSSVIINDCTTSTEQRAFSVDNGGSTTGQGAPGLIRVFNNFCLEVPGGVTTSGTKVQINACVAGNANQQWQWNSNGTISWAGHNKCLDLTDGVLGNGNEIQIWTCTTNNPNQKWSSNPLANPLAQVSLTQNDVFCMGANSSANGAPVFITRCDDASSRVVWTLPQIGHGNSGTYKFGFGAGNTAPFKCLDVTDGRAVAGTKLQLWDCTVGNVNQAWIPTDTIRWLGTSAANPFCVDVTNNIGTKGNQLQIWNCNGNAVQAWSDVSPPQTRV